MVVLEGRRVILICMGGREAVEGVVRGRRRIRRSIRPVSTRISMHSASTRSSSMQGNSMPSSNTLGSSSSSTRNSSIISVSSSKLNNRRITRSSSTSGEAIAVPKPQLPERRGPSGLWVWLAAGLAKLSALLMIR